MQLPYRAVCYLKLLKITDILNNENILHVPTLNNKELFINDNVSCYIENKDCMAVIVKLAVIISKHQKSDKKSM